MPKFRPGDTVIDEGGHVFVIERVVIHATRTKGEVLYDMACPCHKFPDQSRIQRVTELELMTRYRRGGDA